uniref:Cation efflux protein transmembrane domain-containing protein n=1 Tax=Alexandrium catenella TaxID=2925 RepID=A0A7S1PNS3_ALECA
MEELAYITKESPYEAKEIPFRQYPLKEVVELAKRKHGEEGLLTHYRYYLRKSVDSELSRKVYGNHPEDEDDPDPRPDRTGGAGLLKGKRYWYNAPSTSTTEGRQSVLQGLRTNVAICTVKGAVWVSTGSHVMFADWMHSIADVANYSYRLLELQRSAKQRDFSHPYGYAPLRYITADRSFVFLCFVGGVCPLMLGLSELVEAGGLITMPQFFLAPSAVFVISGVLEGIAMRVAWHEILALSEKERRVTARDDATPSRSTLEDLRQVLRYLREGRDVMSTATFTEASSGMLGAGIGVIGLGASWYLESGVPDVAASIVMASMVCVAGGFLLRKSGNALLGQTLPGWRVKALITRLEAHAAVVNVYDVKTEMVGTDTVRFKAEVQFNPQAISEHILRAGSFQAAEAPSRLASPDARKAYLVLAQRLREILPQLHRGLPMPAVAVSEAESDAAAWLYRNNGVFYEALAWELKDMEHVLREELRDFRNIHIDLEPW